MLRPMGDGRSLFVLAAIACAWTEGIASAQPPVDPATTQSFVSLKDRLPVGDVVYVTDAIGATIKGTLAALTDDAVQVKVGRTLRRVPATEVRRIQWRQPDSPLTGLLIGGAVGAVPGIYYLVVDPNECNGLCPEEYGLIAVGAVVGTLMDLAIQGRVTVFVAGAASERGQRVTICPLVARDRHGVRVTLRF